MSPTPAPVKLFYSYAHEDEDLRLELQGHLKILERRGLIAPWHDRAIVPGQDWNREIHQNLLDAELVLLLISSDFFSSDYIFGQELRVAMERQLAGTMELVHVLLRKVDLSPEDAEDFPFLKLQGLPPDLRPVVSWPDRDEAWTHVAKGIRATVKQIQQRRPSDRVLESPAGCAPSLMVVTNPVAQWIDPYGGSEMELSARGGSEADPLLQRVLDRSLMEARDAARARGEAPIDVAQLEAQAVLLIDDPEQKRVLWVDDRPGNNSREMAFFRKLQIEITGVTSTIAALEQLKSDPEAFDVVISDWDRDQEPPDAGLRLALLVRQIAPSLPFVCYHAESDPTRRKRRADALASAGVLGETVYPTELIDLVLNALKRGHNPSHG